MYACCYFSSSQIFVACPWGSSVPEILQARTLEWVAMPSSRGSSQPRGQTCVPYVSCIGRRVLYHSGHLGSLYLNTASPKPSLEPACSCLISFLPVTSTFSTTGFMVHYLLYLHDPHRNHLWLIYYQNNTLLHYKPEERWSPQRKQNTWRNIEKVRKTKKWLLRHVKRNRGGEYKYLKGLGQKTRILSVMSYPWKMRVIHSPIMKHTYYYRKVTPGDCLEVLTCRKHVTVKMNQSYGN